MFLYMLRGIVLYIQEKLSNDAANSAINKDLVEIDNTVVIYHRLCHSRNFL